ncbi:DUF1542 domain-containing protein [Limosilactobacillus agrestimuris]|uniref:DUF1542 domain-containing protein n=1 Tax=Limosilactobacillus agrestimuris TaxID=2941331 RepID=UPI00203B862C|nr:DUF1542 domain-containing protein [Limosilactobacillus agrestimuris]
MVSKNNRKLIASKNRENEKQRFGLRKLNVGVASVLLGVTFSVYGGGQLVAHADTTNVGDQAADTQKTNEGGTSLVDQKQVTLTKTKTNQDTTESSAKTTTPAQSGDQTTAQAQTKTEDQASVDTKTDTSDSAKNQTNVDKQTATESKTDQASEDQAAKANNAQTVSVKKATADDNASTTAKDQSTTTDQAAVKDEENNDAQANDGKTTILSLTKGSVLKVQAAMASLVQIKAATNDEAATVTVTDAQGLIDAIQNGTATTINIGANIDLGEKTSSNYTNTNISNKRNITIQSADGKHYTVDFNGYGFNMYSNDYGVTFKDLDLYGRSYFGIVRSAGSYTFDNVNYTGSQLIYTDSGYNTTVNFDGNVTAHSVGSYTSPLNNKSQASQGGNNQQVIQFAGGTNTINFNSGSNVTLTTTNSNVLEVDGGKTTINVKNGAQVSLNPHTQNGPEQINGMNMDGIARGIASKGDTTLNIDQGGNLDISLTKNTEDKYLSSALYLNSGATINVNGNLNIDSDGTPYYRYQGWDDPVYINGNAAINVNGGSFKVNATNMGDYKGSVVTSNGNSTIAISHHGTFDVTGDGTQATGVSLGNGSIFTSTQPELFNISMPDDATAIKNGKVQFKGVKTSADGQPIGEIDITYASNGTPTVTKVTSYDEATTTATRTAGNNAKNKINLVAAGEEVNLSGVKFVKNADGTYTMSGNANTADKKGAYVYISVNGQVHQVAPTDSQTLWTAEATGDPASSQVPYTAETGADGKFTVNLGKLKDTDQVSVYGAKDFVTSDTDTKTVSEWMTNSYRDQLQKLVAEAPNVETGSNFTNATDNLKTAYTNAISAGSTLLRNSSATSEQLDAAAKQITDAKAALNGDLNKVKQELQVAVDAAPDFEKTSATYYNANPAKQNAYTDAISAGSDALKAQNPTVESLTTALNKINEAKNALDGKATDTSKLKAAVDNANTVKASNDYKDASADYQKQYDDAVKAGQQLLDPTTAPSPLTQADVDRAAKAITDAQSALTTSATTSVKDAKEKATADLTTAVDAAKAAIDQDTNLTEDERNAAKAQVDSDASAAQEAINNATTNDAVTSAVTAGKVTIDKTVANAAIDNAAAGKKAEIAQSSLTTDEKKALDDKVAQEVTTAKNAIAKATTPADVTTAQKNGVKTINDINVPSTSTQKDEAKDNINKAAADAKKEIDQDTNLTEDERNAAKAQVDSDASAAQEAINNATTNDAVTSAVTAGKVTIDKTVANAAIDNAAAGKNKEIANSPLTTDEQNKLHDQVAKEVKTAKDNINSATIPTEVTTAKDNGVKAINGVKIPTTSPEKDKAKENLDKQVQDAKDAIDKDTNLTDDQKQAAKNQIDTDAKNAQDAIDNAKSDDDIKKATDAGQLAIDKTVADAAIDNAVAGKLNDIKDPLTKEEKQTYTDLINEAANNAKQQVTDATTPAAVTKAQEDGVNAIDKINVPTTSPVKDAANTAIDKALQDKTNEINNATNITDQEKQNLIKRATEAANTAKENIKNADSNSAVITAQTNGEKAIADVTVPGLSNVKKQSTDLINKTLDKKKDEINNASNLSNDEKQQLINDATKAATDAINNINNAKTNDEAKAAADTGAQNIENISIPGLDNAKKDANQAIDDALNAKKNEINNASNLSDQEKQGLIDKAEEAAKTAKDNINSATTNDAVKDAESKGVDSIKGITFTNLDDAKKAANQAIDDALNTKTNEINNASNLSDQEKQDLINKATDAANTAKNNITKATTNDAVTDAQNKGIQEIASVTVPSLDETKQNAINAIKQVQEAKDKQISDAKNLNADQQKSLTDQVNKIADDAIAKINDPATSTNDGVKSVCDNAIDQITNLFIPTLDGAQDDATDAITAAKDAKIDEINNAKNLSDQEKQDLTDQVNQAADDATKAIKDATTNDAVKDAETKGLNDINNIKVPSLVEKQQEAKDAVAKAADAKNQAIDNSNLTSDEKTALKKQVSDAQTAANKAIDDASTDAEVTKAQNDGIDNINKIAIPETSDAKSKATTDLKDAVDNAKKAIDQDTNLTNDQKQVAKDAIDHDAKTAQEAINNANTDSDVKKATDNGQLAIDKDVANAAIDNAAAGKKAEIAKSPLTSDEKQDLNNQVDQAAKDAKDAIKAAQNDGAVKAAQEDGVKKIDDIKVPTTPVTPTLDEAKDSANTAIDNAATAKKDAIKAAQDAGTITADQAADLNKQVDQAANEAKQAVNNATTASQVDQAQNNGVQKINNINIPSITDAKDAAKTAIDQAAKNKDDEIDASNLSDQEKADLKNEVKVIADTAKKNIDSVDSAAEVENAKNDGIAAINGIKVATSSDNQNEQSGNNGSTIDNGSGEATNNNGSQAGSVTGATTSQSNGAKISATGLNSKNAVRTNANKQAAQLPQTGNQTNAGLGVVGLAAASLAGLFGFTKLGKKKED